MLASALLLTLSQVHHAIADRLVGSWRYEDRQTSVGVPVAGPCATDFGASYMPDWSFTGYDEAGEWRIEGNQLIEIVWEPELASGLTPRASDPEVRRFEMEWLSADVVNLRNASGEVGAMIRCSE